MPTNKQQAASLSLFPGWPKQAPHLRNLKEATAGNREAMARVLCIHYLWSPSQNSAQKFSAKGIGHLRTKALIFAHRVNVSVFLVECRTHDRTVAGSNPNRNGGRIFFTRVDFGADSCSVSVPPLVLPKWHVKDPRHFQKCRWQVTPTQTHTLDPMKSEWADCRCPGIVWEPIQKQAHMQIVRECLATITSAHWATVDCSWP